MKTKYVVVVLVVIVSLALSACNNKNAQAQGVWWNVWTWGDEVARPSSGSAGSPAVAVSGGGDFVLAPNTLGVKPAPGENVDPLIYKKPYEAGTITDNQGNGIWTQSGKNGSAELRGTIPADAYLEVDSYILWKGDQTFTGGNLIVVAGPLDLAVANVSYKDGGANLVRGDLQAFLDDNVWGKFCRGNIAPDGKSFTYVPWALKNIQLPAGFSFKPLSDCPKSAADDHTTIPDLP
jgi:hypothetical protein